MFSHLSLNIETGINFIEWPFRIALLSLRPSETQLLKPLRVQALNIGWPLSKNL